MLEILQTMGDMVHAFGDISIVKQISFMDYTGIAENVGEVNQYAFDYANGHHALAGVCENKASQLHCQTNIFDGVSVFQVKDIIEMKSNDVVSELVEFYEIKINHLDNFITKNGVNVTFISKPI